MPLIALVARMAFTFHGREIAAGECFEASAIETVLLQAARKATFARSEQAHTLPPTRTTRRYRRRDMTADLE